MSTTARKQPVRSGRRRRAKKQSIPNRQPVIKAVTPYSYCNVSQCARDYWHTLVNPFEGPIGCVPSQIPIRSLKTRVWSSGVFNTGAAASGPFGWIVCDPLNAVASDEPSVAYSISGATATAINFTAGQWTDAFTNSMFTQTEFGSSNVKNEFRVVGSGLRVRYAGTELNKGGYYTILQHPDHMSLIDFDSDDMQGFIQARRYPVDNNWVTVTYSPVDMQDYEFRASSFVGFSSITSSNQRWYMGLTVNTPVANTPFLYEFFTCHEVVGRAVRGATMTHADPNGLAAGVTAAVSTYPSNKPAPAQEVAFSTKAINYLRTGMSTAYEVTKFGNEVLKTINTTAKDLVGIKIPRQAIMGDQ